MMDRAGTDYTQSTLASSSSPSYPDGAQARYAPLGSPSGHHSGITFSTPPIHGSVDAKIRRTSRWLPRRDQSDLPAFGPILVLPPSPTGDNVGPLPGSRRLRPTTST